MSENMYRLLSAYNEDSNMIKATSGDYAEIGEWSDGNPDNLGRVGYFVTISNNSDGAIIDIANSTSDVVGVTVENPAFVSNADKSKFSNDELSSKYANVCVLGLAQVIDDGTCTVKGRCMPNDSGIATKSSNNMGYQVISRVDDTHIIIAVSPNSDMIQRIKTDVSSLDSDLGTLSSLTTTSKTNVVSVINELDKDLGTLSSLTTTNKTNVVSAINELDRDIGTLSSTTATTSANGLMSRTDKSKLDNIANNANNYSLPTANATTLGGVKSTNTGTQTGRDYNVQINNDGTMKVNVPWYNTNDVTGVKGNGETDYRKGNVNITKSNIGLGSVDNTPDSEKSVKYATTASILNSDTSSGCYTTNKNIIFVTRDGVEINIGSEETYDYIRPAKDYQAYPPSSDNGMTGTIYIGSPTRYWSSSYIMDNYSSYIDNTTCNSKGEENDTILNYGVLRNYGDIVGYNITASKVLYSKDGTVSKSDRNAKKDIAPLSDKYEALFDDIKPCIYRFIDNESNRLHVGAISQDIEESLEKVGLDSTEFAGFCKEKKKIYEEDEDGRKTFKGYEEDEDGNPVYEYFLRYEEFIMLNTHQIQKAKKRIASLEETVEKILEDNASLKARLDALEK